MSWKNVCVKPACSHSWTSLHALESELPTAHHKARAVKQPECASRCNCATHVEAKARVRLIDADCAHTIMWKRYPRNIELVTVSLWEASVGGDRVL